jgi:eukaryotic-like serine/threonine-protein kinase
MLLADPRARPSVGEVHATLMSLRSATLTTTARAPLPMRAPTAAHASSPSVSTRSRPAGSGSTLRGKGLRLAPGPSRRPSDGPTSATPATDSSGLKGRLGQGRTLLGKLLGKLEERREP